jgi:hypothetical protein
MQIVFTVRTPCSSAKPMAASNALQAYLEARAPRQWRWNVPRWDDGRLTRMSVDIADVQIAVRALNEWGPVYRTWEAAARDCSQAARPIRVTTNGWLDDVSAKQILHNLADQYPGQKIGVKSLYCRQTWGFIPK